MSKFNTKLKTKLSNKSASTGFIATSAIPKPTAVNREKHSAYEFQDWFKLISILNTSKLQDQAYRTENQTVNELRQLINKLGKQDPYFTAQCIIYSRCLGEGMRSINHLASVFLAPFISGTPWGQRFYSKWDKKKQIGGCIFRTDDMSEIMAAYKFFNKKSLPNSMKKGFATTIENSSLYEFGKYTKQIRDVANMVHPNPELTPDVKLYVGGPVTRKERALDYIMRGNNIPAYTWENAQSEAGQEVAKAVREGKISQTEATALLQEAKAENWTQLLQEGKLGILAALRNIRNILLNNPNEATILALNTLLIDSDKIIQGKIMPYQFDLANEVIMNEFNSRESRSVSSALLIGYEAALPNLTEILQGDNLVIIDVSGSMWMQSGKLRPSGQNRVYNSFSGDKALLIGSTIAKATKADIIRFGGKAEYVQYNPNQDIFTLAASMKKSMGSTNLESAWELAARSGRKYNRVFILSDNECNEGNTYNAYTRYMAKVGDPYVYSIDLAALGTTQQVGPKVKYYYGYGFSMFDDIVKSEFNPAHQIDKIRAIKL